MYSRVAAHVLSVIILFTERDMPTNIEIKARVADVDRLVSKVREFSDTKDGTELNQEDTFFCSRNGRLKLRQTEVISSNAYFLVIIRCTCLLYLILNLLNYGHAFSTNILG